MSDLRRIVFCSAIGKPRYAEMAMGLGRSLSLIGDDTARTILTDIQGFDWPRYYSQVVEAPPEFSRLSKLFAFQWTDAEQALFIDADCLAFRRLAPIFDQGQGSGLAVQGEWIDHGRWHGADVSEVCRKLGVERIPKFNGGLIVYERSADFNALLALALEFERDYVRFGFEESRGKPSDEACISMAMAKSGLGMVMPDSADFTSSAAGAIGGIKLDVRSNTCRFLSRKGKVRYIEPYIFHASEYSNFTVYWRQLAYLKRLEEYEDAHRPGYRSRLFRLRRSLERRYLKLIGKN